MLNWLFRRLSREKQKAFVLNALDELLTCKDSSIDQKTALHIIEKVSKSKGNKFTAFLLQDNVQ